MSEKIKEFVRRHQEETLELLHDLTIIPAPTGEEYKRAEYIRSWLLSHGIENVMEDVTGNILCPYHCSDAKDVLVVSAHMDTVFSSDTDLTITEKDGRLYAPGIGDDTANLVNMLMCILYLKEQNKSDIPSILFVANVGEEGLGNLNGSKAIYNAYQGRIRAWISFDLYYNGLYNHAVGSHRYRITVKTKGGHSFGDYGNANAIAILSEIICNLYHTDVPTMAKTTINVGKISGGTTVNAIASKAEMLFEFRSEQDDCLRIMEGSFRQIIEKHRNKGDDFKIEVELLGIRPGHGKPDPAAEEALTEYCLAAMRQYYDGEIRILSASTDCNIPLSQHIPAVTLGTVMGGELHTTNEWIEKESLLTGQAIAIEVISGDRSVSRI